MAGICVAKSMLLFRHDVVDAEKILTSLQLPLFVKPNNGGSSLGISKVKQADELIPALEKAFREDEQVLVEECITGREFTIGVFGAEEGVMTLPITEIISSNEFFDYEAKYLGASSEITPAEVGEDIASKIRSRAKDIYRTFRCRGVVRIDFIYDDEKGEPFMLEINTVPGQSEASIVPQQVRAMGWTLTRFYSEIIRQSLAKTP
jgi:D-alanine-D-alanine ligase